MTARKRPALGEPMTIAVLRDGWPESVFQGHVERLARALGWMAYHTWASMHSARGFPDLVLVKDGRIVFAELKAQRGKVTGDQIEWIEALRSTPAEVYVWRPGDWEAICAVLEGGIEGPRSEVRGPRGGGGTHGPRQAAL